MAYEERPQWFKNWEETGLLKFEDKNGDGHIQFYNDGTLPTPNKDFVAPSDWNGNELTVNNDILVLALPEIANMPGWIIGLIAAGGCCCTVNRIRSDAGHFLSR